MPSLFMNFKLCNVKRASVFSVENCSWLLQSQFALPAQAPSHRLCLLLSRSEMPTKLDAKKAKCFITCYQKILELV